MKLLAVGSMAKFRFTGVTGSRAGVGSFGSLSQYARGKTGCTGGTKRDTKSRPSTLIIGDGATCGL